MELQALLALFGLGVAGIAVVLLMGLFSNSGTSYEEAMKQQRKATTELLALADSKNKSKKSNKKAIKKQAKKEKKESVSASTASDQESEAPAESGLEDEPALEATKGHVEFNPQVEVEVPRDNPPNVKIRKRGKEPKVKPILLNKEDPSCVSDPATTTANVTNHFEEMHPKDDLELLHTSLASDKPQEKVEEVVEKRDKPVKKGKTATKPAAAAAVVVAEPVKEEVAREKHNSGEQAPKEQRKAKKAEKKPEKPVEEVIEVAEAVVPPLNAPQPSELTTEKLMKQALVNAPPAPAAAAASSSATSTPPGGKKKKKAEPNVLSLMAGDSSGINVNELIRVVRDAALSRTEIQILTEALLNKHHDPLPQHSEWSEGPNDPMQKLKKQLADKEKALADEMEASQGFQAKLKELRTNLNAEKSRAASVGRASELAAAAARAEAHTLQTRLQRLMEENHSLAQDKLMLQSKLGVEGEVQAQRAQLEMHIQKLSEGEAALLQQIAVLHAECQAHALDATAARDAGCMAQQHAEAMAQQLQEATRACGEIEQQRQMALHSEQRQVQERMAAMAELQNEVQRLSARALAAESNVEKQKEDTEKIRSELDKVRADHEKVRAELEKVRAEADKIKAESESSKTEYDISKAEFEKQKQQLSSELSSLGEQLSARESELAELKQMKATAPAQNGLPNDSHKATELAKVESVVESLRGELAAAQCGSKDQREQLARLQEQLAHYQGKNNESIAKAQEAQYIEVATVLRAAWPAAAPAAAADRDWLQAFADSLRNDLQKRDAEKLHLEKKTLELEKITQELEKKATQKAVAPLSAAPPTDDRLAELQTEKEHLQGLVDKYKRVIDETEGVLSRLQHNVTTEEQRWAKQLSDKQNELDELRQRTVSQMQNKIDALEAQLSEAGKTNHNHSFAEAERNTEERLMAGLSEKLAATGSIII